MKYLFLLLVGFLGFYFYSSIDNRFDPNDSRMLFKHMIDGGEVSASDVITASVSFSQKLCNDASYQATGGHTITSCHKQLDTFKQICTDKIFPNKEKIYSNKDEVGSLFKRFINCVGT